MAATPARTMVTRVIAAMGPAPTSEADVWDWRSRLVISSGEIEGDGDVLPDGEDDGVSDVEGEVEDDGDAVVLLDDDGDAEVLLDGDGDGDAVLVVDGDGDGDAVVLLDCDGDAVVLLDGDGDAVDDGEKLLEGDGLLDGLGDAVGIRSWTPGRADTGCSASCPTFCSLPYPRRPEDPCPQQITSPLVICAQV